ncbi:MAG: methylmalonyl-CoA mutase family protein [Pseudomonadota bacterium]
MEIKDISKEKEDTSFYTRSKIRVKSVYTPEDLKHFDYERDIGDPGKSPFVRGIYPEMYRTQPWMVLQLFGFETIEATRERMEMLFKEGSSGYDAFDITAFNMIPDVPGCSAAIDADDPLARGLVGRCGVSLSTREDFRKLLDGLPLEKLHLSLIAHSSAPGMYALWMAQAMDQGFPIERMRGDIVACVDEGFLQNRREYSPEGALRIRADMIKYSVRNTPHINFNLDTSQIREAGANAIQELGFGLSRAIASIEECIKRGVTVDEVASVVSFHVNGENDFFEEICKLRAMRRMWSKIIGDRFGSKNPKSQRAKIFVQTSGSSLTLQQPLNNIARVTIQGLAAVLGGVNALSLDCYDEAASIPSERAAKQSLRIHQILRYESNVTNVVDPLAGSYFVESLTNEIEEKTWDCIKRVEDHGGWCKAVRSGMIKSEVAQNAYEYSNDVWTGKRIVVGVNKFKEEEPDDEIAMGHEYHEDEQIIIDRVKKFKKERNQTLVDDGLSRLKDAALDEEADMTPRMIDAAKCGATMGEICGVLKEVFGWEVW